MEQKTKDKLMFIFANFWIWAIVIVIFAGALIYCAEQLNTHANLKELFFWSAIMLIMIREFTHSLSSLTFHKEESQ